MSKHAHYQTLPIVYSCSGCSNAAQLANHVAVRLDREGLAEMSCIAGVGGDVASLVKVARAGRPIVEWGNGDIPHSVPATVAIRRKG